MNTDIVMNNTTEALSVAVKVVKGEEMRRFNFKGQSFQELKKFISEIFSISEENFSLQYQDDEKDRVTLSSDAELKEAIQIHKYVLRFFVVTKPAAGETNTPSPFPHPHHHPHRHHGYGHGPHHGHPHGAEVMVAEGDATVPPPPPFGRHGPHGHGPHGHHGHGPFPGPHRHHGHGPHGHHKRRFEKEEKEAMKCERKRWKKQRKCESSSSSSEDEAQKMQKKEMKQLMKATKQSIKANWAPIKEANPAQWGENRQLMIAEIKMAKRIILEQANKPSTPVVVAAVTEQNTPVVPAGVEMQA